MISEMPAEMMSQQIWGAPPGLAKKKRVCVFACVCVGVCVCMCERVGVREVDMCV